MGDVGNGDMPRFGVAGVGATGGYLAAALCSAGFDVTVLARGRTADVIRTDGLTVHEPDGSVTVAHPRVAEQSDRTEPVDVTFFCVKAYDTRAAAAAAASLVGSEGLIVCLQNGVVNESILEAQFGADRLLSGVMYIGSERTAPAVVHRATPARVIFGPYAGESTKPVWEPVQEALSAAGIEATLDPDIRRAKWQKFLFNCGLNPLTTLSGSRLGRIRSTPAGNDLFRALVSEALEAARADGAPVDEGTFGRVMETADRMDISSSMAEDLTAGRAMELEAFTGHVLDLSRAHALDAPTTKTIHQLLELLAQTREVAVRQ